MTDAPAQPALCLHRPELAQVPDLLKRQHFFWLDLESPTQDELQQLAADLHLHPLTLEDASAWSERPKREHYEGYVSLVVYGVDASAPPGDPILREVHLIISGDYVVSLHPERFDVLDQLRVRLSAHAVRSEQALIYQILDSVISTFTPTLGRVDDDIDEVEQAVIERPREESLQRIFSLKRDLIAMRRVVTPMRDFFARDADEIAALPGMEPDQTLYMRDLYDTLIRTSDLIDSYRDLLSGATDMYLSTVANRQGEISKQLTIIATIFLPLSFLTGFFGQNFSFLVNDVLNQTWAFWVLGPGLLAVSICLLIVYFRRRGWLSAD